MKNSKKESLKRNGKDWNVNTLLINGKDKDTNIQRIKLSIKKPLNKSLSKSKKNSLQNKKQNSNLISNSSLEKLYGGGVTKIIKNEKITLKNIQKLQKVIRVKLIKI